MKSITCHQFATARRHRRTLGALAWGVILWTGCNGGDATAPRQTDLDTETPATAPAPTAPLRLERVIGPDTLRAGSLFALEGDGFATGPLANDVRIVVGDVQVPVHVLIATPARLDLRLPEAAALPCVPTGAHTLRLTSAARSAHTTVTLAVAHRLHLAAGHAEPLLSAAASRCTELVADSTGARFAVAVLNTARATTSTAPLTVRAAERAPAAGAMASRSTALQQPGAPAALAAPTAPEHAAASLAALAAGTLDHTLTGATPHDPHADHLAREATRLATLGPAGALWAAERSRRGAVAPGVLPPREGQILSRSAMYSSCQSATPITARVVYVGQRLTVLEDVDGPRSRSIDDVLRAIGQEFDAVMYPLLTEQVGDPLALNAAMQGDGRVTMLVSRFVNDSAPGTSAFVTACNLYPRRTVPSSNEAPLFYVRAPLAGESADAWRRTMRSTVLHEAKHLASFAERLARGAPFEEPWLEEATARVAEELYARTFPGGGAWRANTGWAGSLQCEVHRCDDRPLTLWKHMPVLHDFFAAVESRTPLGGTSSGDVSFYASGWSLVRWAIDHFATNEATFLRDLVRGVSGATGATHTGLDALAARTGQTPEQMLAEWSFANLLDDRLGFTPARATLTFPSWHLPQLMAGLAGLQAGRYTATPLPVRDITGDRLLTVPALRGFTASYLESSVSAGGTQLLELRGANGAALPSTIRLGVVRVQ